MRQVVSSLLCATMLLAGACAQDKKPAAGKSPATPDTVSGKQTYTIAIDHRSPDGKQYGFSAFYPKSVRVRPGDGVVFDNQSTQNPHTVTFGVATDRSNQPALFSQGVTNPAAFAPCYTSEEPNPQMVSCPARAGESPAGSPTSTGTGSTETASPGAERPAPAYTGQGFWNSGLVAFDVPGVPSPPPPEARKVRLELADSIAPGSYHFVCVLHRFMDGTIEVVNEDEDRVSPDAVSRAASEAYDIDLAAAAKLAEPQVGTKAGTTTVTAGVSDRVTTVNKFFPASAKVKAGDTVAWKNEGPYEPHTVTFQSPFKTPEDPGAFLPGGVASGKPYTGGFAHSGFFGPQPFPGGSFSLKFPQPGSFPYLCIVHPGMGGVVEVE